MYIFFNLIESKKIWNCLSKAKAKAGEDDWENWFTDQEKELQQIFQGQSQIREILTNLHKKMDEVVGRQERSLSILGVLQVRTYLLNSNNEWNF